MPFLEISHSAKLGTVVGSIDLSRLTDQRQPEAALLPGTMPQANRGILLVDEINRLAETAPDLADVLLSAMGTKPGRIQIEETGLPVVELPVEVSVWAASNPDEEPGPLEDVRRQLADRFDLVVPVRRPGDVQVVRDILAKRSRAVNPGVLPPPDTLRYRAQKLPDVGLSSYLEEMIARIYIDYRLESLRAVEALAHTARLSAVVADRDEATMKDLLKVAPLVLRHRVEPAALNQILKELSSRQAAGSSTPLPPRRSEGEPGESNNAPSSTQRKQSGAEMVDAESIDSDNSWHKLVSKLRGLLPSSNSGETQKSSHAHGRGGRSGGGITHGNQQTVTGQAGAQRQMADPTDLPITSPPLRARPLVLLPATELVLRAEMIDR